MSIVVYISCNQQNPYGTCTNFSLPAPTVEEARARAEAAGWYLKPSGDLCPWHAGSKP